MSRTFNVALMMDASSHFGRECILGISRYAREHPNWSFHLHPRWPAVWRLELANWRGDAIIAQIADAALSHALHRLSIPVVNVSTVLPKPQFTSVIPDNLKAGRIGAEHLLGMHHRHYGYAGFTGYAYARDIGDGFVRRVREAGWKCQTYLPEAAFGEEFQWKREFASMSKWLRELPKPAAVLACNDMRARHVLTVCQRIGLRIPDDIALVGVGNDLLTCEFVSPRLSSVDLGPQRIGYAAAQQAARLIDQHAAPSRPVLIAPAGIIPRRSSSLLAVQDALVAEALRFIREHAREMIQVPDVVHALAVSRRHLERRFIECIGHSPGEEIRRTRIAMAKHMLVDSDQPIYLIAAACGFSDPARLNEVFRRGTGLPPSQFRRRFRNSPH